MLRHVKRVMLNVITCFMLLNFCVWLDFIVYENVHIFLSRRLSRPMRMCDYNGCM